jgi:hypothetical protein
MFHTLLRHWQRLRPPRSEGKYESAKAALSPDFETADWSYADWDSDARASTAAHMIERGTSPELIKSAYGNELFGAALSLLHPTQLSYLVRTKADTLFGPELDRLSDLVKIVEAAEMLRRGQDAQQIRQAYGNDAFLAALSLLEQDRATSIVYSLAADFDSRKLEGTPKGNRVLAAAELLARGAEPRLIRRAFTGDVFLIALRVIEPAEVLFVIRSSFDPGWARGHESVCRLFVKRAAREEGGKVLESLALLRREIAPEIVQRAYGDDTFSVAFDLFRRESPGVSQRGHSAA